MTPSVSRCPILLISFLFLGAAGCSSVAERGDAAAAVAQRLSRAVEGGDGAGACAALAPDTAAEVTRGAGKPCEQAILEEELPAPAEVVETRVYGQRALVRLADDTVFLAVFPDGWRVVAAGCRERGDRPYVCSVRGG